MARDVKTVKIENIWSTEVPCYGAPWKTDTLRIYKMTDDDGTVYVWKTTAMLGKWLRIPDPNDPSGSLVRESWLSAHKGDIVKIAGSVKGFRNYKGETETELTRVKLVEVVFDAEAEREAKRIARENEKAAAKEALLAGVKDGDEIITMNYKRYKDHYADCETVPDSYKEYFDSRGIRYADSTIDVIVREGRMVPSGVRGKKFRTYFVNFVLDGEETREGYYAVSYENAEKRCRKDFPNGKDFHFGMVTHDSPRYID